LEESLNPIKFPEEQLDDQIFYLTERGEELFTTPIKTITSETNEKKGEYIDFRGTYERLQEKYQEIVDNPKSYTNHTTGKTRT
jgi:hypothetical protein